MGAVGFEPTYSEEEGFTVSILLLKYIKIEETALCKCKTINNLSTQLFKLVSA